MKPIFRFFPVIPFAFAAAALLSSSCATVEKETAENRFKGYVVPSGPGAVWGRVRLAGAASSGQAVALSTDARTGAKGPPPTGSFATDDDGGLANVFIHISRGLEGRRFDPPTEPVIVESRDSQFQPGVTGVRVGQKLIWKSTDKRGHNLVSHPASPRNPSFNYALMPNVTVETSYPAPEMFMRHGTDAAPGMDAYVCVVQHPYFAVTDTHGMFSLPGNLPPGRYTLTAQHATAEAVSAETTIGVADNARVEFLLAAPGSSQAGRVASVESLPTSAKIASTARATRPMESLPASVTLRKIDFGRPVKTAAATPAPQPVQPTGQTSDTSENRGAVVPPRVKLTSLKQTPASVSKTTVTRVFKIDAERLLKGLRDSYSGDAANASLKSLFGYALGKGANPDGAGDSLPSIALNADGGALIVRADAAEMERVQSLIEVLNLAPAQVSLDARIMEVAVKDFDRYIESHPVYSQTLNTENFNGILKEGEFRDMLHRLSEMKGARLVYAPSVTTLSGRLAEFQFDPETTLSIEPTVGPNGENVRMEVLFALFAPGEAKVDNAKPDQSVKTTASVLNGQTIMLGGLIKVEGAGRSRLSSRDKNVVMLLITPTVLDASGRPTDGK